MRIIQVIPAFVLGGAETMCANLSIELAKQGHNVQVISLYNYQSSITDYLHKNGVEVVYLNKKKGIQISVIKDLMTCFKNFKPDVVHTHLYASKYAHIAAWLSGIKVKVHTIHSIAYHADGKANQIVNRFLFKVLGVIPVSLSEEVKKTVVDLYKIKPKKTPIVLNGVPLEKCIPIQTYSEEATRILHVGRFSTPKNHMEMIRGFALAHEKNRRIHLYLYGEGELKKEAEKLVSDLQIGEYIHFCGTTSDVYSVMNKADVFILPSLWEGVPMTLIEAMGTGLPIIASRVGGISNMISDGENGILIDPTAEALAKAIILIATDGKKREKLGLNALKKSVDFSSKKMVRKYVEVYKTVLLRKS
jgi:glycosyltransferase involved in cell wall biosynthesis